MKSNNYEFWVRVETESFCKHFKFVEWLDFPTTLKTIHERILLLGVEYLNDIFEDTLKGSMLRWTQSLNVAKSKEPFGVYNFQQVILRINEYTSLVIWIGVN